MYNADLVVHTGAYDHNFNNHVDYGDVTDGCI